MPSAPRPAGHQPIIGQCMNPACAVWVRRGSALVKQVANGRLYACSVECASVVDRLMKARG